MTRFLLALLLVSCGHVTKRSHESTAKQEATSQTDTSAVATERLNVAELKQSGKRTARKRITSPDGWVVDLELVDEMLTVAKTGALHVDQSSKSRTAEASKTSTEVIKELEERQPWWWSTWFVTAVIIGLLALLVFLFRKVIW